MQQMHKVLCKHQGKARTARVPAQKLAAPRQTTSYLRHTCPKPQGAPRRPLALTCSAGAASPQPGAGTGGNTMGEGDPTHTHVWSALPVKRVVFSLET